MGLLAAALLNRGKTTLKRVPKIEEVYRMVEVLQSIGVRLAWVGEPNGDGIGMDLEIIPPEKFDLDALDSGAAEKTRSIIMLIGSLAHSLKKFKLPQPGGCKLGSRTVKPHLFALEKLGINIETTETHYEISVGKMPTAGTTTEIILYESGDTVTENAIIAAAGIPATTVIKYASANYMGQEVCFFLERLGVKVEGIGTTTISVHGVDASEINQTVEYELSEDPIETMFFLAAAIVTNSSITIERCPIDFLELELYKLEKMGFKYEILKRYMAKNGRTKLVDLQTKPSLAHLEAPEEKIESRPYPGLNIDNQPFFAVIATQAKGMTLIHDWVYEKRAIQLQELNKLGAETLLADPHRIYITGPSVLKAADITCPPALRPAAIILIGMLAAEGTSVLRNIYSINRGYEDIIKRLNLLGAKIKILGN